MPSKDLEKFMWDMLVLLEKRGLIKATRAANDFCRVCEKKHQFGWHDHLKTGDSFYLCTPTGKALLEFQTSEDTPSGRWVVVEWIDLINQLF